MKTLPLWLLTIIGLLPTVPLPAQEVIGVSEPVHLVDLAFPESGIISQISVKEGESVKKDQVLASLDNRVLDTQLRIARIRAASAAKIQSSQSEWEMRSRRLKQLEALATRGSANEDELAKARSDAATAEAELQLASEEKEQHKIEAMQIEAQIDQRTLRSPIDGVVTRVFREQAENVSPSDPVVLSLAQLDTLEIVMHVDPAQAALLHQGQSLLVASLQDGTKGDATVAFISPVTDSASGTTRVRLTLPNAEDHHRSGVKYRVQLGQGVAAAER